jgi:hypothetical protein
MDTQYKSRIYNIEKQFCKQVDCIITTSDYLNSKKEEVKPTSYVVKKIVDFKLFAPHSKKLFQSPDTIKKGRIHRTLDFRFDIDSMEYAIKELPHVLF